MKYGPLLSTLALLTTTSLTGAQVCTEEESLAPSGVGDERFGLALDVDGPRWIVGAPAATAGGVGSGVVYVFDRATGLELHRLSPSTPQAGASFGNGVALDGSRLLVAAPGDVGGAGSAYLFDPESGAEVTRVTNLFGGPADDFGDAVALGAGRALVGAPGVVLGRGIVFVYDAEFGTSLPSLTADDPDLGDRFGSAIAISGTTALIGAPQDDDDGDRSGSAYLFDLVTGQQLHKLRASDGQPLTYFGSSVAIEGDRALVGAPFGDGQSAGAAYLFDVTTGAELAKITAPVPLGAADDFGSGLALHGDLALVGASTGDPAPGQGGAAFLFDANSGAALTGLFSTSATQFRFGLSVAMDADGALVGDFDDGPGAAHVFRTATSRWNDLGSGLAGTAGAPRLLGCGALALGESVELSVTGALPNAAAVVVIGVGELGVPFLGGTLVPSPDILINGTTDGAGRLTVASGVFTAPIPPGVARYVQVFVVDAGGPAGAAASNAVRVESR